MNDVAVHLSRDLAERLDTVAAEEQRSRANAARWLLDEALRRRETQPAAADDDGWRVR